MLIAFVICRRQMGLKSGAAQPRLPQETLHKPSRLTQRHPESNFMVRQVWIAAFLKVRDLPLAGRFGSQVYLRIKPDR
jgi:hypothetical protein